MRRICIIVICLLVILSAQTAHGEMLPRNVTDALTPEAEEILRDLGDGGYDHGTLLRGLERIWGTVCQTFLHLFRGNVNGAVLLLGVVLLCGVIGDMGRAADSAAGNYVTLGGVLVITTITAGSLRSLMETGMEAMEQLDVFAKALLPTLAAAVAAGGGVVSASVRQVLTVLFTNLLITAIRTLLLPLVYCYVAAAVANAALPDHDLKRLQDGALAYTKDGLAMKDVYDWYKSPQGERGESYAPILLLTDRAAGHDIAVDIDRINRITDRDTVVLRKEFLNIG